MSEGSKKSPILLFLGTFVSAFLFVFGMVTLLLLFAPIFIATTKADTPYYPQLPIAANREEDFLDLNKESAKQLFPELTQVDTIAPGNWIHIPSIGVHVPLASSPTLDDKDIITTLNSGAALYPNGILPGRLGNTFIAAHSTGEPWKGKYRFAFLKINEVKPGNIIHLDYEGTRYTYRVIDSHIIKPQPNFRVPSDRPVPTITLMACWPLWTVDQRMLVQGELTNITKLTPTPS